jgi:nitrogen fixation/metabolism regulation signal transduction histidine kinase
MAHLFFGRRFDTYVAALLLAGVTAGCATAPKLPPPPTTAEIVQMAKDGQTADAIIQRMQQSVAVYPLPASELAKLREQGVPDKVIDHMQQTFLEAVRYQEWARARETFPPFYGPYPYSFWGHYYWR